MKLYINKMDSEKNTEINKTNKIIYNIISVNSPAPYKSKLRRKIIRIKSKL